MDGARDGRRERFAGGRRGAAAVVRRVPSAARQPGGAGRRVQHTVVDEDGRAEQGASDAVSDLQREAAVTQHEQAELAAGRPQGKDDEPGADL